MGLAVVFPQSSLPRVATFPSASDAVRIGGVSRHNPLGNGGTVMGWFSFFGRKSETSEDKPAKTTQATTERPVPTPAKPGSKTIVSPLGNRTSRTASGTDITMTTAGRKIFKKTESTGKGKVTKTYAYDQEELKRSRRKKK